MAGGTRSAPDPASDTPDEDGVQTCMARLSERGWMMWMIREIAVRRNVSDQIRAIQLLPDAIGPPHVVLQGTPRALRATFAELPLDASERMRLEARLGPFPDSRIDRRREMPPRTRSIRQT